MGIYTIEWKLEIKKHKRENNLEKKIYCKSRNKNARFNQLLILIRRLSLKIWIGNNPLEVPR